MAARRRGNREGSLRQRPNGTWEAAVMVGFHNITGARNVKYFYGKTRDEARRKMQKYLDDRERGLDVDSEYTVADWFRIFMQTKVRSIRAATAENYEYIGRLILRHIGAKRLRDVRPLDIENMLLDLRDEGRSDSALSKVRGLSYSIFQSAMADGRLVNNPTALASRLRKRRPKEKQTFSKEQVMQLMRELPSDRVGLSLKLLLCSGLRCQELLALTKDDIEPDGSKIYVRSAVSMVRGHVSVATPKTFDSYRTIVIPEMTRDYVKALRNTPDKYILQSPTGEVPINPSTFRKYYKQALQSVPGIPYMSPHCCRHSYITLLQTAGVDLATAQSLAGHSSKYMTLYYTHVPDSQKENAAEKLSALIGETKKESALPL